MPNHPTSDPIKDRNVMAMPESGVRMLRSASSLRSHLIQFVLFTLALTGCFALPLYQLVHYALNDQFFSYIPLIPFIALYLVWIKKPELPSEAGRSWKGGVVAALAGGGLLLGWQLLLQSGWQPRREDYLTVMTATYIIFIVAGCFVFLGARLTRLLAFPLLFIFMVPMPAGMLDKVTMFFQKTSAVMASGFLTVAQMPVMRDNLTLNLPGYSIWVAPECSGIHSTMVLLITAVLGGYMFLRSGWKRALLIVFVIPLAIVRNGFRIFVVSELCVQISHDMINSPIHRKGGPIFFALSLIPFFALLLWLRKTEPNTQKAVSTGPAV